MKTLVLMILKGIWRFLVNLITAMCGEQFVAKLFFSGFEAVASKTTTLTDDKICKDMQEAYYSYLEKKVK